MMKIVNILKIEQGHNTESWLWLGSGNRDVCTSERAESQRERMKENIRNCQIVHALKVDKAAEYVRRVMSHLLNDGLDGESLHYTLRFV